MNIDKYLVTEAGIKAQSKKYTISGLPSSKQDMTVVLDKLFPWTKKSVGKSWDILDRDTVKGTFTVVHHKTDATVDKVYAKKRKLTVK